jgi:hypothetical protein
LHYGNLAFYRLVASAELQGDGFVRTTAQELAHSFDFGVGPWTPDLKGETELGRPGQNRKAGKANRSLQMIQQLGQFCPVSRKPICPSEGQIELRGPKIFLLRIGPVLDPTAMAKFVFRSASRSSAYLACDWMIRNPSH